MYCSRAFVSAGLTALKALRSRCMPAFVASASLTFAVSVLALLLIEALRTSSEGRFLPAVVFGQVASPLGSDRAPVGIDTLIDEEPRSDGPAVSFAYSTKGLFFTAVLTSPPSALLLSMKMTEARPLES